MQAPTKGMEPGFGRINVPCWHATPRCKCFMVTIHNLVKVKLGITVIKFVKSLFCMEVTVAGRGSEFVRDRLHIAEKDFSSDHTNS